MSALILQFHGATATEGLGRVALAVPHDMGVLSLGLQHAVSNRLPPCRLSPRHSL